MGTCAGDTNLLESELKGGIIVAGYKPPFHLTEEIMSLAMEIGESIGAIMVDSTMSPDPKLRRESRVRSIYSSLAIE